ncbi:MAG: DNA mismatch repair endonuclease MutL [Planctomycetota bacterium]
MRTQGPPEIAQLPEVVANKIAAGEVVERPANVVKELVENSIDAGATRIVVRIEDGGRRLVEVVDDGHGIRPDCLVRALDRHATSKLRGAEDLFRVASLGFRGEALPSMAAVSEFELASRPADQPAGTRVSMAGADRGEPATCGMPPGTRVSVRNLFWNVPVRLKFLKARGTETGHVTDMVIRLALAHPEIGFVYEAEGRTVLDLPPCDDLRARIRAIHGRDLAAALVPVAAHADATQLTGFIAGPQEARPTGRRQFVFLNGRWITDKTVVAAIREGYRGFVEPRLKPTVYLRIDMDPSLVDVNVHPTKTEVRFRRQREVFDLVRRTVAAALEEHGGSYALLAAPDTLPASGAAPRPPPSPQTPALQERFLPSSPRIESSSQADDADDAPAPPLAGTRVAEQAADWDREPDLPGVVQIVQLGDSYILVETDQGLRIIDQHALHEKALILHLAGRGEDLGAGGRQELLLPRTVELAAAEIAAVEPHLALLSERGIEAEVFGPTSLVLRAVPALLDRLDWQVFFSELATRGEERDPLAGLIESRAHRRACHAAVKANQRLAPAEMRALVALLYRVEGLERCPHGRPTTLDLDWNELERRFMR